MRARHRATRQDRREARRRAGAHQTTSPRALGSTAVTALVAGCALVGSGVAPAVQEASAAFAAGVDARSGASTPIAPSALAAARAPVVPASAEEPVLPEPGPPAEPAPVEPAVAAPTAVSIPAIGVRSSLVPLGVAADGTLEVPTDPAQAGWFTGGALPGALGPAVVAGHVDSRRGPGVFLDLEDLGVGEEVVVEREDGTAARFVVTGSLQVPKGQFPSDDVYGPTAAAELRLITCGGVFDHATGHYLDNLVVFARLAA
jgi:hypothetical protein